MESFISIFFLAFSMITVITGILLVIFCFDNMLETYDGVEFGLLIIMLIASCLLIFAGGMLGVSVISGI
jgi:ABC-type siderophore export system fused ATPase/permease subunit